MTIKRYAVLGGGGSFGIHTSKFLLAQPGVERVIGVGRNPLRPEAFSLNIGKGDPRYRYHTYHVGYEQDLMLDMLDREQPEVIVNFAAQGEGAVSWKDSWRFFETNCTALAMLVEELAKRPYLKRFIQIGTSEMYGSVDHPVTEDEPIKPSSPYAASKVAFDLHLVSMHKVMKFPMNILRPSNAYGPGQLLHRIIPKAVVCGLTDRKVPLHGGGRAEKSYIHSQDLARAIWLVAEGAPLGRIYNVGPDKPIAIRTVVEKIAQQLGMAFEDLCEVTGDRIGQDSRYWLDSTAIRCDVGWQPYTSIEIGIAEMIMWGNQYLSTLRDWPMDYTLRA